MLVLGINQDFYDCGVALTDGQKVLYSANEERFNRRKNQGGFPWHSLEGLFRFTGVEPADIDRICVAGEMTPPLAMRMFPSIHKWVIRTRKESKESFMNRLMDFIIFHTSACHMSADSLMRRFTRPFLAPVMRQTLQKGLRQAPISFVEHHLAHAASAWFLSGFQESLVVTGDGMGDGLSLTVNRYSSQGAQRLWSASAHDSFGLFFEMLTEALGFTPCRDESKLMTLAAAGDPKAVTVPSPFYLSCGRLCYNGPVGRRGVLWAKETLVLRFSREDISAWAQELLESNLIEIVKQWLKATGLRRLAVAGGIFTNVKLNQRLHQLEEVEELFVCPNMGDGGLSLGAICARGGLRPQKLSDVFWGDSYNDVQIRNALEQTNLRYRECQDIEKEIAGLLVKGKVVARFTGRMEWGPRALGNRSILTQTMDQAMPGRLNRLLRRSDFMPFAPAVLKEDVSEYALGVNGAGHAAEFMTVCFPGTTRMQKEHPAAVHVDGTSRMQIVRQESNPAFYRILSEYKKISGKGILLNTSLNIHEEPIVRTPQEAIAVFLVASLDYLAIGKYLVAAEHI